MDSKDPNSSGKKNAPKSSTDSGQQAVKVAQELLKLITRQTLEWEGIRSNTYAYTKALGSSKTIADKLVGQQLSMVALSNTLNERAQKAIRFDHQKLFYAGRINNIQQNALEIAEQQVQAQADLLLKRTMLETGLAGLFASQAAELKIMQTKGLLTQQEYKAEIEKLKKREKAVEHYKKEVELVEQIAESIKEIKVEASEWKHSFDKLLLSSKAIATSPTLLKAFMVGQAAKAVEHLTHAMHEFKDVGMTAGEAVSAKMRSLASFRDILGLTKEAEVNKEVITQYGTINALTKQQSDLIGSIAYDYGLAGKEIVDLTMAVGRMPGQTRDTAVNFNKTVEQVSKLRGVLPSQIMKEMVKNTSNMALYSKGGASGFALAAASAKKMGVELSNMLSAAEKTLDFESSINAQMEASMMIGREINLDKLRQATLSGDANAILQEQQRLMQQVGGLDSLNLLQKKALANAMGMSVEEMVKITDQANFQNKYFGEQAGILANLTGNVLKYGEGILNVATSYGPMVAALITYISQMRLVNVLEAQNGITKQVGILSSIKKVASLATERVATWLGVAATQAETVAQTANTASKAASIPVTTAAGAAARSAGAAAGAGAAGMLAFGLGALMVGGAVALVGAGVWLAAEGLAALVASFKGLSGTEVLGAAVAIGAVGAATYFLIPAITAAGIASVAAAPGLLALGATFLLIGGGVALASYGISTLVSSIKDLPVSALLSFSGGLLTLSASLIAFSGTALLIGPSLVSLSILGGSLMLAGMGLQLVADNLDTLTSKITQVRLLSATIADLAKNLSLVSVAGALSLPVITVLNGLSGGEKEERTPSQNQTKSLSIDTEPLETLVNQLIEEVKQLKNNMQQPGTVLLDGRKVGDALRLSGLNSSGIR